ncbi:hypothetical protein, partial [Vibrio parahaemolyticus]|uniref:hypothetical protein n=1 Tax=Vibrio parahaemolyticus TaxID=670 RepID=UPI00192A18CE
MRPVLFPLSALSLAIATTVAHAQTATGDRQTLDAVEVQASASASAKGLSPAYSGGQVATGGEVGLLGSQSVMETPYNF